METGEGRATRGKELGEKYAGQALAIDETEKYFLCNEVEI